MSNLLVAVVVCITVVHLIHSSRATSCNVSQSIIKPKQISAVPAQLPVPSSDSNPNRHSVAPLVTNKNFFTKQQMDLAEEAIYGNNENHNHISEHSHRTILARLLILGYADLYTHRYENFKELRESGGPHVSQTKCLRQLEHLVGRAEENLRMNIESKDINFHRLLDTFGRVPAGMFDGDTTWLGAYDACVRMQINLPDGQQTGSRYCLASLRHKSWPNDDETLEHVTVFKTAVCLPRACDSRSYKNKYNLIQHLIEFNARQADLNATFVSNLYCLPDEQSNLRIWWKSKPTLIVVSLISAWLSLLIYATYKDEKQGPTTTPGESRAQLYRSLSITNNLRSLFSTNETKATNSSQKMESAAAAGETCADLKIVNLDMVEGIKVLAAMYIVCGHVMMISTGILKNSKEISLSTSISYTMSNLMPAFAVNIFFAITGILTAYTVFKQNQTHSFIRSPAKWAAFIFYRYLRMMPMYALVTLFCKHVARYLGDGPLWDYGTSSLAARRNCEQEPWAWTLLFGANFKSPMKHCVPSAWYLANDFQFFLVTPLFLAALHLRPTLGKRLLYGCIGAGYVAGFLNVFFSAAHDIKPIATFAPYGFMTYITFLYDNYTRPQYRIPAYLAGLLMGYQLYQYEQQKRQRYSLVKQQQQQPQVTEKLDGDGEAVTSDSTADDECLWPSWMVRYGTTIAALVAIIVAGTPSVGSRIPYGKLLTARTLVAFIMPTYHLMLASGVGINILLAATGYGNKFVNRLLSMKVWKPLARLSLCVVLINVEVIAYIVQTHKSMHSLTNQYHTCLNMLSISCTYLVATFVCVLFESPIRAVLNHLLALVLSRATTKREKTE